MERKGGQGVVIGVLLISLMIFGGKVWAQEKTVSDATYVGREKCQECHEDEVAKFVETRMGKIFSQGPRNALEQRVCESCHGPGSAHVEDPLDPKAMLYFGKKSSASVAEQNRACLQCHEKGGQTYWIGSPHEARGMACTECHKVMEKTADRFQLVSEDEVTPFYARRANSEVCFQCHLQKRAQLLRSSHMPLREGKIDCSDCHNPHGTATPALLIENSVNENCYKCHAEKRGPFLWEHPPVLENCLNCHEPHGSIHADLLKVKMPRLCQQCHIDIRHPTEPFAPTSRFVFNRSCTNCHSQIHGSNHPSGVMFQR